MTVEIVAGAARGLQAAGPARVISSFIRAPAGAPPLMPESSSPDLLFQDAEQLASDFSLFPRSSNPSVPHNIEGLVSERRIRQRLRELRHLSVDEYVHEAVAPSEDPSRPGVRPLLKLLGWRILRELERGPLYAAEVVLEIDGAKRKIGLLAQDRSQNNGAWGPEHHLRAVQVARELATQLTPIVTLIDTPGLDDNVYIGRLRIFLYIPLRYIPMGP